MKKASLLLIALVSILFFNACKKEPKESSDGSDTGPKAGMTNLDLRVVLPAGNSLDLSKTKIYSMGKAYAVSADGKATISVIKNSCNNVFLFDQTDRLVLMSYVYTENKEISIKTTAQALLFNGLQLNFLSDSLRYSFLNLSASSDKLTSYYTQMEQAFKTDHLLLEKRGFVTLLKEAIKASKPVTIDILAKQVNVLDGLVKSKLKVEKADDENINILNMWYRRAHAFVYKKGFRDANDNWQTIFQVIDFDDAAEKDLKVNKVKKERNVLTNYGNLTNPQPVTTGPIGVPIKANEKEVKYGIRIIGPGNPALVALTNVEKAKLKELYYDYLAYDILAPFMLDAVGTRGFENTANKYINMLDDDKLSSFRFNVEQIAKDDPGILAAIQAGNVTSAIKKFAAAMAATDQTATGIISALFNELSDAVGGAVKFPTQNELLDVKAKTKKTLDFLDDLIDVSDDPFILVRYDDYKEMEEFEVLVNTHNVKVSPKTSDVMAFTNHALTVNANTVLNNGETLEYEWKTAGTFGVLKNGSTEGTTFTTTANNINYYGKNTPNENNIEKVIVTAYIKNNGGTKTKYGADTANINVKKIRINMKPTGAVLSPKYDNSSLKLYLLNADGTDPIVNNSSVQYRVNWSTAGTYGHFAGGTTQQTTTVNHITYNATDKEVKKGVETITAKVEFRITQGNGWSAWMHRETIVGQVRVENDVKVIYVQRVPNHPAHGDYCVMQTVVKIPVDNNAKSYRAVFTDIPNLVGEEITVSFTPTNLPSSVWLENGFYVVYNFASSQHVSHGHLPAKDAPGGAFVTITY